MIVFELFLTIIEHLKANYLKIFVLYIEIHRLNQPSRLDFLQGVAQRAA
jgi:hypothetical protein